MLGFSPLATTPFSDEGAVDPNAEVNLVGVQGSFAVGAPLVVGSSAFEVLGLSAGADAGSVSIAEGSGVTALPDGNSTAALVFGPLVTGDAVFELSGVFANFSMGEATGAAGAVAVVQGPDAAVTQLQPAVVVGGANAAVEGLPVVAETGQVFLWSLVSPNLPSNWTDVLS